MFRIFHLAVNRRHMSKVTQLNVKEANRESYLGLVVNAQSPIKERYYNITSLFCHIRNCQVRNYQNDAHTRKSNQRVQHPFEGWNHGMALSHYHVYRWYWMACAHYAWCQYSLAGVAHRSRQYIPCLLVNRSSQPSSMHYALQCNWKGGHQHRLRPSIHWCQE